MGAKNVEDVYPLSPMQEGLLFHSLYAQDHAVYVTHITCTLENLDVPAFERAWQQAMDRHPALRTAFVWQNLQKPLQIVTRGVKIRIDQHDWRALSQEEQDARLNTFLQSEQNRDFKLSKAPLVRLTLFQIAAGTFQFVYSHHHLLLDGWSDYLLLNEVFTLYEAWRKGQELHLEQPRPYRDYIAWLAQQDLSQAEDYWRRLLQGFNAPTALGVDQSPGSLPSQDEKTIYFRLPVQITDALRVQAREQGLTLNNLTQGVWALLLSRYSGDQDVVFGATVSGRPIEMKGVEKMMGVFINTLPVRVRVAPDVPVLSWLRELQTAQLAMRQYEYSPLVQIQGWSDVPRGVPLFDTILDFENHTAGTSLEDLGQTLKVRNAQTEIKMEYPLFVKATPGAELLFTISYDRQRFDDATIARLTGHLQTLLSGVAGAREGDVVRELGWLSESEREEIVYGWNETGAAVESELSIAEEIGARARELGNAVAVVSGREEVSYEELNARANQLGHYLRRLGVGPETVVGVCLERSVELVVALVGVLKAGGAYLPLDPSYPRERLEWMLLDAGVQVVVSEEHLREVLGEYGGRVVCLDSESELVAVESREELLAGVDDENLAYVIYTSGSTGRPKGVMVQQGNVKNFCCGMDQSLSAGGLEGTRETWLAVTSVSFDISVLELLWSLRRGSRVVLQSEVVTREAGRELGAPVEPELALTSGSVEGEEAETRELEFSLFYFAATSASSNGNSNGNSHRDRYRLLLEGARYADEHGYKAVWTPERHFHEFGGLYPNPAVTSAALATITERVELRAGSVVLPLHNPLRVAEEWSVIDNLSGGRVGVSFASGWHADDFVLAPEHYAQRHQVMEEGIELVRRLWRGEGARLRGGSGQEVEVHIQPRPVQRELPVWVTAAGAVETFRQAGRLGAGVLTHLLGQSVEDVATKVAAYREAWREAGHAGRGHVTLMLHTFVGAEEAAVKRQVRQPMLEYLSSSLGLIERLAKSLGKDLGGAQLSGSDYDEVLEYAFERYYEKSGLLGPVGKCVEMVGRLRRLGIDEVACLIDFGPGVAEVLESLHYLDEVRRRSRAELLAARRRAERSLPLSEQLRRHEVTHLQCTPTLAGALWQEPETRRGLSQLQQLLCGGEALPGSLAGVLRETVRGSVHNMYGPTETTIWSSTHEVNATDAATPIVSLGRPIANTQLYLLDEALQPVPVGVRGELYIGGDGVARGYWNRGELTADRFVPDPFSKRGGQRLYRTGDEARYLANGELEYLGRSDQQVKLRGYRIELGEIEAALREHESVGSAAVAVRGERLVAYIVPALTQVAEEADAANEQTPAATQPTVSASELRAHLQQRLPEYMVPSYYLTLAALPQTPNGKLDRKALPEPDSSAGLSGTEYEAPRTPVEEVLAAIVAEVLQVPRVGRQDDFFALGGHSLLAMQVISRIREAFQVELPVRVLFESPTLAGLAAYLEQVRGSGLAKSDAPPLRRLERSQPLPLSFAQQRLWFLDRFEADRHLYNVPVRVELRGALEHARLQESLNRVMQRHEVLRTSFREVAGQPLQQIDEALALELPLVDLSDWREAARETEAQRLADAELFEPFNLEQAPLWRARLVRLSADNHRLLLTLHHAVCDGWSLGVLLKEVAAYYEQGAAAELPALPVQYADYAAWQREWLQGAVLEQQLSYWRERLQGAPAALELATDYPRPALHRYRGATLSYQLAASLSSELQALSRREGVTLLMLLLGSLQLLLSRYTGATDISVGLPVAGRNRVETEGLVGLFLNTLVLRTEWEGNPTFRELLGRVREVALGAYAHQELPFEKLVEELQPERDLSRTPLFQVLLVLQNAPLPEPPRQELQVGGLEVATRSTNYELTVSVTETDGGLQVMLDYNALLFAEQRMQRLLRHWERLLASAVAMPNGRVLQLGWLSEAERAELVYGWNQTAVGYGSAVSVTQMIAAQALEQPQALAVVSDAQQLSYAELEQRANQLAHYLRGLGVGAETVVGVCLERTVLLPVALLGVLKAGGAYLPLDPGYPRERLEWVLADAGVQVVLSEAHLVNVLGEFGERVVYLDGEQEQREIAQQGSAELVSDTNSENLAYLIYTSGSTGRPKGVGVTHGNLVNFLLSMQREPGLTAADTLVAVTTLSFDIAGLELYLPLISGGCLVLADRETAADGHRLLQLLRERHGTTMQATPATWRLLLDALAAEEVKEPLPLKVLCGGEALPGSLTAELRATFKGAVYNLYGPTETTIWSALHEVNERDAETPIVSLGRPIANTQLYLLDEALQPVPVGVRGELYIGGDGVARGYWNRGELTADRFVPDPFSKRGGQRLYRTGDEARYLANGELEYLGRTDQQVKLRGYRIELGEIEAALREHESVGSAAVAVRGDRLVAYLVPAINQTQPTIDGKLLRAHLQQRLPEYMVPSYYVSLDALPQTPNGKLDRKALPDPEPGAGQTGTEYEAPRTPVEEVLAAIVAEVLQVPRVGRQDDFFALGGHSLLAMQVISRIREAFQVELPVRVLFETPALAGVAHQVDRARNSDATKTEMPPLRRLDRGQPLPLSFAQQRLWFLDQLEPGSPLYNIPAAVRLTGHLDLSALNHAFRDVVQRHESLRTRFHEANGRAVQIVEPEPQLRLSIEDLQHLPPAEREAKVSRITRDEARRPFDLSQVPLLRVRLLHLADNEHVMLVTIHHIIGDEWSMGVLVRELATLYAAHSQAQPSPLPELPIQYADYAAWQREWLQGELLTSEIDYWRKQLHALPILDLPTDHPRPAIQSYHGARYWFEISPQVTKEIDALAQQQRVTRFMTLLAAFQTLLHRYSAQDDIVIGTPIAGRSRVDTESLIGLFVNTLVLRGDLSGDPDFNELLRRVRDTAFAAYAHADVPFEKLVEQLQPERDLSRTPLFQIGFVLQNDPLQSMEAPGLKLDQIPVDTGTAKFDLLLAMVEEPHGLRGSVEYNTDLFDDSTIERLASHFQNLLASIVEDPTQKLSQLQILGTTERAQLLAQAAQTSVQPDESLSCLFELQVEKTPAAAAVVFENQSLSYADLNSRANQLAHYLRELGVGPESKVGICMERSIEMVIALLGILKAGGAYVPLDPAYPPQRLSFMVEDTQMSVLLGHANLKDAVPGYTGRWVDLASDWETISTYSSENFDAQTTAGNVAYVIYTSGSTGNPKGVLVTHGNVTRLFTSTRDDFRFDENDVWTFFHSFAFDFSVWEIWGALLHGGRLVVVPYLVSRSPADFYNLLRAERVTVLNQTPSSFLQLIKVEKDHGPAEDLSLRLVIFGGEALDLQSLRPWMAHHGDQKPLLVNMYGITETTVHVTCRPLGAGDVEGELGSVIGNSISDLQLYVLDQHQQPVPWKVPAELCVGGLGLARGYLNNPDLTAQKFIPDPYSEVPGCRLYRSGDSARRLPDGEIEYLGRLDQQVKIKGFRIELGEIETVLSLHPAVRECLVIAREDVPGDKQLTAYVVAQPAESPNVTDLRSCLKQKLPEYMIPASFVLLAAFPLTPNGKLDRRALPAPDNVRPDLDGAYVAPQTVVEKSLAQIWSDVLHLDRVGVHDSFFALGGDSIRSIEVRSRAEQVGIRFSLQQLFQYQTISELSRQLNGTTVNAPPSEAVGPWSLVTDADRRRFTDEIEDAYPLAMLQAGMLFHSEYAASAATYHDVFSFRVRAPFEETALRSAVEQLMLRHAVLRTSFDVSSFSEPLQLVHVSAPVPLAIDDVSHLAAIDQDNVISSWLSEEGKTRFDWTSAPLFRIQVHRRSAETFQFSLSFHHAILDGWSVATMLTELFQTYLSNLGHAVTESDSLPETNYRDFVALERQAIGSSQAKDFWLQRLDGASNHRLPRWTSSNGDVAESKAQVVTIPIPSDVFTGLKQLAQSISAPLKSVLLAAHLRVLCLLSGQTEIVTGLVSNGRPEQSGAERTLGLFLNTLPVRANLRGGTWEELVKQTLEIEKEILPFRWYPLANMQQQRGGEAFFETGFSFNHFHVYERLRNIEGIEVLDENVFEQTNFTLGTIFNLDSTSSQLHLQLNYNAAELAAEQIDAIGDYYLATLDRMAVTPAAHYASTCLLPALEQRRLLLEWNETQAEFPTELCIHQWFEAQAERTPNATALVFEGDEISFRRLNERANQLAHRLQRMGVGPESLVGICLERGVELIVGLLGILKAGGAYVPLDPVYPRERLRLMLDDARAQVLVTQASLQPLLDGYNGQTVCLDNQSEAIAAENTANCASDVAAANLAYVIYTSGSTGKPKGVMITHNGVCNTLRWRQVAFSLSENDRILQTISIAFDPSVWQIFGSLLTGSCLVLASPGGDKDVSYLLKIFREQKITICDFVPSMLQAFLDADPQDACQHLRHVFCGGEVLPAELLEQFFKSMPARIHNMYGPTEGTIDTTSWPCEHLENGRGVSIGRPVANKQVYLLDAHLQPAPTGVPGHLHIGGTGLTRGYLHQPQLTAEKLIPNPFSTEAGAQLYRSGDLARYLPDGSIEFLGRLDHQVKVRGFRIEVEEIEAALTNHDAVQTSVVLARERVKGEKELVAYVVAAEQAQRPAAAELRGYLRQRLPEYMVPAYFVCLDELPFTPNGKLDRLSLPAPAELRLQRETAYLAPRNELEKMVAKVWQETLQLDQVGVHENFFDLGGHSLLMLRIQGKVRTLFNRDLSIVEMFRYPTISSLAEILGSEPPQQQSLEETEQRAVIAKAATRRRRERRKSQPI